MSKGEKLKMNVNFSEVGEVHDLIKVQKFNRNCCAG